MSPVGRFLIVNCDNNLRIDLRDNNIRAMYHYIGCTYGHVRYVALSMGITLIGGS